MFAESKGQDGAMMLALAVDDSRAASLEQLTAGVKNEAGHCQSDESCRSSWRGTDLYSSLTP